MWVKPASLFLVANLLYFLFPFFETLNTTLYSQTNYQRYSPLTKVTLENKLEKTRLSLEDYTKVYESKSGSIAKLLLIFFVLLSSVPLYLIYFRKYSYFTDHLTLALEFNSYLIFCLVLIFSPLIQILFFISTNSTFDASNIVSDRSVSLLIGLFMVYFLTRAGLTFYKAGKIEAFTKSLLLILFIFLSLTIYRFLLFYVTILMT